MLQTILLSTINTKITSVGDEELTHSYLPLLRVILPNLSSGGQRFSQSDIRIETVFLILLLGTNCFGLSESGCFDGPFALYHCISDVVGGHRLSPKGEAG